MDPKKPTKSSGGLFDQINGDQLVTAEQAMDMGANLGGSPQPSGGGLFDQMGIGGGSDAGAPVVDRMDVNSPTYQSSIENSKLPPAIKEAMKSNPIPQPDGLGGVDIDPEFLAEINPKMKQQSQQQITEVYSENDERDFFEHPIQPQIKDREIPRTQPSLTEGTVTNAGSIRKMIAEEIAKALPKVIEDYFDKRVIKENVQFKAGNTTFSGTVSPLPKKRTKSRTK
jgi:hypothetical protein